MNQVFPDTSMESDKDTELINALLRPSAYDHPVSHLRLIQTHISWVILTGQFAYKIKKPLDLGFLDFSSLNKRQFYCEEEIRLNKRLAADIYLEVVAITGDCENPVIKPVVGIETNERIIEYAVKMVEFPQDLELDKMLERGELGSSHIKEIAKMLARFHGEIESATSSIQYGSPAHVFSPIEENFRQIRECIQGESIRTGLDRLESWCKSEYEKLIPVLKQRKEKGFVRECHGDLHMRNLAWFKNHPIAFDCLEFNPELRWIDVMSEIAFIYMDLHDRNSMNLAQILLNRYLEISGDYAGVSVLTFYLVYRALVRAKVDVIRIKQTGISDTEKKNTENEFKSYLDLAENYTLNQDVKLIITRGVSASGKTTLTLPILERITAIRIRSDVERKRLFSKVKNKTHVGFNEGLYQHSYTEKTYAHLLELTEIICLSGFSVIVDASFLLEKNRMPFMRLAERLKTKFIILEFIATDAELKKRIIAREKGYSDADLEVQQRQLESWQDLSVTENNHRVSVNTEEKYSVDHIIEKINAIS